MEINYEIIKAYGIKATLFCALIVLIIHYFVPKVRTFDIIDMSILNSVAGGIGISAILVQRIPALIEGLPNMSQTFEVSIWCNLKRLLSHLCLSLMDGFCLMYTIEKISIDIKKKGENPSKLIYSSHLFILVCLFFALSSALPPLFFVSPYSMLIVLSLIIAEIIMEDHALVKHFGDMYNKTGRLIITASILGGWMFGVIFLGDRTPHISISIMDFFITGVLILAVIKTEFDLLQQKSHYPTFLISIFIQIIMIIAMFYFEMHHTGQYT